MAVFDPARPLKGGQRRFLSHQWARMYSQRHDAVLLANPVACSHKTQRVLNSSIDLGAVAEADQGAWQLFTGRSCIRLSAAVSFLHPIRTVELQDCDRCLGGRFRTTPTVEFGTWTAPQPPPWLRQFGSVKGLPGPSFWQFAFG